MKLTRVIFLSAVITVPTAMPQQPTSEMPKAGAPRTKVVLLGTGTPVPDPDRSGHATAIVVDDSAYIVDFGPGIVRRAKAAVLDRHIAALEPANLKVAFVTHLSCNLGVVRSAAKMATSGPTSPYALGSTDAEHERLIRQAVYLTPLTERFFQEAGIGPGQRVLDLGSGVGDVALLAARLVGSSGEVVGVERDSRSMVRARARVGAAGLTNVSFTQCDVSALRSPKPFDAAVGRFILQWVSDPVAILGSLSRLVRPGGVVAFQEVSYAPFLALSVRLPLWSATASLLHETMRRSGANMEVGVELHQMFQEAGLPAPNMRLEMLLGSDPNLTRWTYDLLFSLRLQIQQLNVSLEPLGDFDTLLQRLQAEVGMSKTVIPFVGMVGAWAQKPAGER